MMTAPQPIRTRYLRAEPADGWWRTTDEHGDVREHLSPKAVLVWSRDEDAGYNLRHSETPVHTEITWVNVPPGFQIPAGALR